MSITTPQDYSNGTQSMVLLESSEELVFKLGNEETPWVLVNSGNTGFYRVHYSDDLVSAFINAIHENKNVFTPVDLVGMIENFFSLAYSGDMNVLDGFRLIEAIVDDASKSLFD